MHCKIFENEADQGNVFVFSPFWNIKKIYSFQ